MEPGHDLGETGRQQTLAVLFEAVGLHHVFDGTAFLGNLQFAVAIGALEGHVQVGEQAMLLGVIEAQLFRKDQRATGQQRLANTAEQGQALLGGNELQGEVQGHHRGGLKFQGEDIALDDVHRQQLLEHRVLGGEVLAAALDHGGGVVHGNDPATVAAHMPAQGLGDRAERAAQVVERRVRLGELGGEHAEVLDNGRVTGHRALDHVREHPHHIFVEGEVGHLAKRLGE
ncbi:hypothetical protein D3C77_316530 [compost metagenome]